MSDYWIKINTEKNPIELEHDSETNKILLESHLITMKNSSDSFKTNDCNSIGFIRFWQINESFNTVFVADMKKKILN